MAFHDTALKADISLKDKIYKELKDDIIFCRLKSGDQLPLQRICQEKNVSSAPVREALNLLSKEGLVDLTPHKRAVVSRLDMQELDVIMYLRYTMEPYAARLSVGKIPQEVLENVRAMVMDVLDHPEDAELYVASDLALHEMLHNYCGSSLLSEFISNIKDRTIRLRYTSEHFSRGREDDLDQQKQVTLTVSREHLAILNAFDTGVEEIVYNQVRQHILNYSVRLRSETPSLLEAIRQGEL